MAISIWKIAAAGIAVAGVAAVAINPCCQGTSAVSEATDDSGEGEEEEEVGEGTITLGDGDTGEGEEGSDE